MKSVLVSLFLLSSVSLIFSQAPTTIDDFFLPGSQPGQSGNLEHPGKCDNCHGGYDLAVEPAFNWRGSMMSQAARDPLFFACLAIANQDAPESGDLCIRCHSPAGWLEGRSIPTDGSALNNNDREGVQCDFCHKLVDPRINGQNPYSADPDYMALTYQQDFDYLTTLAFIPITNANGMYTADANNAKRGPFVDAVARHKMFYSPFHSESAICGTCHDVSNPAYDRQPDDTYLPNAFGAQRDDNFDPYSMFPVERTYSEWLYSDFAANGTTCQDCHLRDVTGAGCNKKGAPIRPDLPLHDMTGGNTFIPLLIESLFPGETDPAALAAGIERARATLQNAATLELLDEANIVDKIETGQPVTVRVTNETGHKLPSGYPEGRRIWLNLQAYDINDVLVYESGEYDPITAVLTHDADLKIYEIKPGISEAVAGAVGRPAGVGFHFALNNEIFSDNRIPPRGFTNANFEFIQSPPVAYTYGDGEFWDDSGYILPLTTAKIVVTLYYQTTTKEYVEFLRDHNVTNDWGQRFYDLWAANGKSAPEVMETITWPAVPVDPPPAAPTNLTARALSSSEISLSWVAPGDNDIQGYNVFRDGAEVASLVTVNEFTDTGLSPSTTYSYYVIAVDNADQTSPPSNTADATTKKQKGGGKPRSTNLAVTGANPFNPSTRFQISIQQSVHTRLEIYNTAGQLVELLTDRTLAPGVYDLDWNAGHVPSGTYFVRLTAGANVFKKKVNLLK